MGDQAAAPLTVTAWMSTPPVPWTLIVHGGAGNRRRDMDDLGRAGFRDGLAAAWNAGAAILGDGGVALDAVCAAVQVLEDDPLFNAGRGAALTDTGHAEHDAAVMTGSGRAGAVAGSRAARNPILAARAVMEHTPHVLIADPSADAVHAWGLQTAEPAYFITPRRLAQVAELRRVAASGPRHGTVGAVARDATGHLAAATSTGGIAGQADGRIGDTPVIGAGTYADDTVAVSCTGEGEAFIRAVTAHELSARIRYARDTLGEAAASVITRGLTDCDAFGGLIAVDSQGAGVIAYNSVMMFAAFDDGTGMSIRT